MTWTDYLIGPSGTVISLSDLGADVTGVSDIPAEYITTRGYRQHGVTVQYAQLAARTLSVSCEVTVRHSSRLQLQAQRDRLLAALSPAQAPDDLVTFRRVLPDGQRRDIQGLVQPGVTFEPFWDRSGFTASFTLMCPDPTFYDPTSRTEALAADEIGAFVVPFVVPVLAELAQRGHYYGLNLGPYKPGIALCADVAGSITDYTTWYGRKIRAYALSNLRLWVSEAAPGDATSSPDPVDAYCFHKAASGLYDVIDLWYFAGNPWRAGDVGNWSREQVGEFAQRLAG